MPSFWPGFTVVNEDDDVFFRRREIDAILPPTGSLHYVARAQAWH
jgi:hypothetical protein